MKQLCVIAAAAFVVATAPLAAQTTVVTGTTFTASGGGTTDPSCVGLLDTWCATNVRNNASVGETNARPQSGNGSLAFSDPGSSGKADFEIDFSAPNRFSLGSITQLGYDYFRDVASTSFGHLVPSLRVLIYQNGIFGALIYEPAYNGVTTAATDSWTTVNITGSTNLWLSQVGCGIQEVYNITLSTWQSAGGSAAGCGGPNFNADALVYGLSTGVGSGWSDTFTGAVDNINYKTTTMNLARNYNFEVAAQSTVPEPSTYALMAAGLAAIAVATRRRKLS